MSRIRLHVIRNEPKFPVRSRAQNHISFPPLSLQADGQ